MTDTPLIVWGIGSTRTMRVHWTAIELGLDYETKPIRTRTPEALSDEYTRLNPKQKIPTLQHGDLVLSESAAIMTYLTQVFDAPDGFLVPQDPATQAKLNEWISFAIMELDANTLYLLRRYKYLSDIYGAAPEACDSAVAYFLKQVNAIADQVPTDSYLINNTFSVADMLMAIAVEWAILYEITPPQRLVDYKNFVARRPGYQKAIRHNFPEWFEEDTDA